MIQKITDLVASSHFSELLDKVHTQGDQIIITHSGQPMAVLIDFALFEQIQHDKIRFQQLSKMLGQQFAHLSEETVVALVDEAVQTIRAT